MNKKILSINLVGIFILAGFCVTSAKENESYPVDLTDSIPDLDAEGYLNFNVNFLDTPNSFDGSFKIKNIGDPGSKLTWVIDSYPNWGSDWYFNPTHGSDLEYMNNISVLIHFQIGYQFPRELKGDIKIINKKDSTDYDIVPVVLTVARSKILNYNFLAFLENHPNLFPIIRQILGLKI
jgi:hypothetical protein